MDVYVDKMYGGLPKFHLVFYQWAGEVFIHLNCNPENFAIVHVSTTDQRIKRKHKIFFSHKKE